MTGGELAAYLDDMTGHKAGVIAVKLAPIAVARAIREARRVVPWLPEMSKNTETSDPLALAFAQAVLEPAQASRNGREAPIQRRMRARTSPEQAVSALRAAYATWCDASFALEAAAPVMAIATEAA